MKIFLSGGSGSLGREIASMLAQEERVVIYSRTEGRQAEMQQALPEGGPRGLRYVLGCISDYQRLCEAMTGCDMVIHAAAQKMIDSCTYNPYESIKTNITGTVNIVRACNEVGVKRAIFVSSDKACDAVSLYGAQKFIGEQIFISSNTYGRCAFNCVRYGNVIGSNKSMFHTWTKQVADKCPITVTDPTMTRFFWGIDDAARFVLNRIRDPYNDRGCIYVPKMRSYRISDIAAVYSKDIMYTGLRCPEKIHESLISEVEAEHTYDRGDYWTIYPGYHYWCSDITTNGTKVPAGFKYTSETEVSQWS